MGATHRDVVDQNMAGSGRDGKAVVRGIGP